VNDPYCARVPRDVVVVTGRDASSFLQSLVSQDLDAVAVGETCRTLLLQPQGKLLVDFSARHHGEDEWWLLCEGGFGPVLADGLRRFKIRVEADIELRAEVGALAWRGGALPPVPADVVAFPVPWGGTPAYDLVGDTDALDALAAEAGAPLVGPDEYERARIEAGVPRMGYDVDDRTIPQEAFLERDAVSFTKGCFVGQELVCRIDTRGHVNRSLRRLRATAPGELQRGAPVEAGGRPVGEVTSAAGEVALAMVRREVEPGAVVDVGGVTARVEPIA
jgi:hypothetical protein